MLRAACSAPSKFIAELERWAKKMSFLIELSGPVEISRLSEVAASPLCHRDKVFERAPGDHWLATTENLYQLIVSSEGFVVGARSREKPCWEFHDLFQTVGVKTEVKSESPENQSKSDWERIAERYGIRGIRRVHRRLPLLKELRPAEEEALRAIQLLAGGDGWVEVALFAHGFAKNLGVTLRSLARKGLVELSSTDKEVRLL